MDPTTLEGIVNLARPVSLREIARATPMIGTALGAREVQLIAAVSTGVVLARTGLLEREPLSVPRLVIQAPYADLGEHLGFAYQAILDPDMFSNAYLTIAMPAPTGIEYENAEEVAEWTDQTKRIAAILNSPIPADYDEHIDRLL